MSEEEIYDKHTRSSLVDLVKQVGELNEETQEEVHEEKHTHSSLADLVFMLIAAIRAHAIVANSDLRVGVESDMQAVKVAELFDHHMDSVLVSPDDDIEEVKE